VSAEAELLREAATQMRKIAAGATQGEWEALDGGDRLVAWNEDGTEFEHVVDEPMSHAGNAVHIAAWDPTVALAVAVWLDESATELEEHIPAWTRPSQGVDDPPALGWDNPEWLAATIQHHFGRPLTVAREFLRREAGDDS
jgi:hypothetical protein